MGKNHGKMDREASRRIQSAQDSQGSKGDQQFKARAMRAADKNAKGK